MRPTGPISKSEMRPTGPKSSSLDFGLEFGDSEISDLLSAATTCHLWGVAPLSGDKQLVTRPVDWSACPGGGFALPSWHAEMFPGQALNRLSLSRNGSSDHSSHADDEWFSTLSSHSGSPRSQKDVPMSPEFFPPIAPNRDGEARGPGLPMDAGLSWSVLSPSLSARAACFLPMSPDADMEAGFIIPPSDYIRRDSSVTHHQMSIPKDRDSSPAASSTSSTRSSRQRGGRGAGGAGGFHARQSSGGSGAPGGARGGTQPANSTGDDGSGGPWREFLKVLKEKEKESFAEARAFARESLGRMPAETHWRVILELADLSKRENKCEEARTIFRRVNEQYPNVHQGWLDYAKMEEEGGDLEESKRILLQGVMVCPENESVLTKCLKLLERLGDLQLAREILSRARVQAGGVEKAWRLVLEGAMIEARAGNKDIARSVFAYLLSEVPWHGPIFTEAVKFEERNERDDLALPICQAGLAAIPRHAPLWFSAMRLSERGCRLGEARLILREAVSNVSRELVWKLHFEAAQMEARASEWPLARAAFADSAKHCPENLQWKVWIGSARSHLAEGKVDAARLLMARGLAHAPSKMKSTVLIEGGRLEEYVGNLEAAREMLSHAREAGGDGSGDWKVYLESAQMELRAGRRDAALRLAAESLKKHGGTGRLWALLIQLCPTDEMKLQAFRRAHRAVPRSGEVWCEGARICLEPTSSLFNLQRARKHVDKAVKYTPQYGDTFLELLRVRLLEGGRAWGGSGLDYGTIERLCVNSEPNYGQKWFACKGHQLDGARQVLRYARQRLLSELGARRREYEEALGREADTGLNFEWEGEELGDEGGEEFLERFCSSAAGGEQEREAVLNDWWLSGQVDAKARFVSIFGPDPLVV